MQVLCPSCQTPHVVPADKLGVPGLKCRCRCGNTFPVEPPIPPAAPAPVPLRPAAAPRPAAAAAPAAPRERPLPGPAWKRCGEHPGRPSTCVCRSCGRAYCRDCERRVRDAPMCPACDSLCRPTAEHEAALRRAEERARPLFSELGSIFSYPLIDPLAFLLLAVVTGVFGALGRIAVYGTAIAVLLSTGILTLYALTAVGRLANGDRRSFTPDFGGIDDLVGPLRLAGVAMLVSAGPLLALLLFFPPELPDASPASSEPVETAAPGPTLPPGLEDLVPQDATAAGEADEVEEAAESASAPTPPPAAGQPSQGLRVLLLLLAALWALVYTPVALIVAAVSRSAVQTLNPVLGVATILRMGSTYWQAAAVYTGIALVSAAVGWALGLIPVLGLVARPFLDAYVYLAVGCLLGLAIFKRARELDLE